MFKAFDHLDGLMSVFILSQQPHSPKLQLRLHGIVSEWPARPSFPEALNKIEFQSILSPATIIGMVAGSNSVSLLPKPIIGMPVPLMNWSE